MTYGELREQIASMPDDEIVEGKSTMQDLYIQVGRYEISVKPEAQQHMGGGRWLIGRDLQVLVDGKSLDIGRTDVYRFQRCWPTRGPSRLN